MNTVTVSVENAPGDSGPMPRAPVSSTSDASLTVSSDR